MRPQWFPMSALLDGELDCWASPAMLRLPLAAGQPARVRYVGDRMWPAFRHGQTVEVEPLRADVRRGDVIAAATGNQLELWRVARVEDRGWSVVADADSEAPRSLPSSAGLAGVRAPRVAGGAMRRVLRRALLEIHEAWSGRPGGGATTVRDKYDFQAAAYAAEGIQLPEPDWLAFVRRHLGEPGRVLVVGSGTGQECHALASIGFECLGIDFSERMVEQAERLLRTTGNPRIRFRTADLRSFDPEPGSFDGILFTPDVYSFLPHRAERIAALRRLRAGIVVGGRCLLSARVPSGAWSRGMRTVQWLRSGGRIERGDSHTRFLAPDGTVHRSFVHCFSDRSLRIETRRAGWTHVGAELGYRVLKSERSGGRID